MSLVVHCARDGPAPVMKSAAPKDPNIPCLTLSLSCTPAWLAWPASFLTSPLRNTIDKGSWSEAGQRTAWHGSHLNS